MYYKYRWFIVIIDNVIAIIFSKVPSVLVIREVIQLHNVITIYRICLKVLFIY